MKDTQIVVVGQDTTVVDLEAALQDELDTLRGNVNEAENFTIFRTPPNISHSKNPHLFVPSVISIGPFHHGQKHLRAMEEQKRRFLRDFLSRRNHISLNRCISEMKQLETRTRRCYNETFDELDSNAFVKMMLLDGCFILKYFLKLKEENVSYSRVIYRDLLLLENQIPFFIVDKLYDLIGFNEDSRMDSLKYIAFTFFARGLTEDHIRYHYLGSTIPEPPKKIDHLVHLCYHYLVPKPEKLDDKSSKSSDFTSANRIIKGLLCWFCSRPVPALCNSTENISSMVIPSATELKKRNSTENISSMVIPSATELKKRNSTENISSMVIPSATELKKKGLKVKPKRNPKHMLDISFEHGVLQIPRLAITAENRPILANLVAFEHCKYVKEHLPATTFVIFLDNLINTVNDVKILQDCGIVENWLGSEEDVTQFINQFTEIDIFERDHYLAKLYMKVNGYIKSNWDQSRWNKQRAKLKREYFSSPWKAISVVAAFILLVLTCVQTFYAVYAYKLPPSS